MAFLDKAEKRHFAAFGYLLSLLPVLLPWCYFDRELDGIKYGIDIVNNTALMILAAVTFSAILTANTGTLSLIFLINILAIFLIYEQIFLKSLTSEKRKPLPLKSNRRSFL